jgi:hypothetical protein
MIWCEEAHVGPALGLSSESEARAVAQDGSEAFSSVTKSAEKLAHMPNEGARARASLRLAEQPRRPSLGDFFIIFCDGRRDGLRKKD